MKILADTREHVRRIRRSCGRRWARRGRRSRRAGGVRRANEDHSRLTSPVSTSGSPPKGRGERALPVAAASDPRRARQCRRPARARLLDLEVDAEVDLLALAQAAVAPDRAQRVERDSPCPDPASSPRSAAPGLGPAGRPRRHGRAARARCPPRAPRAPSSSSSIRKRRASTAAPSCSPEPVARGPADDRPDVDVDPVPGASVRTSWTAAPA